MHTVLEVKTEESPVHEKPSKKPLLIGIGDLHGTYSALEHLLSRLDSEYAIFSRQDTPILRHGVRLVFTGDYIDRGFSGLEVIDCVSRLQAMNPWSAIALIGNHELMALAGLGYAKSLFSEAQEGSSNDLYYDYMQNTLHGGNGGVEFIKQFGDTAQDAFKSYVSRMSRGGDLGDWIWDLEPFYQASFQGKSILFTHGDTPPDTGETADLKRLVMDYYAHLDKASGVLEGSQEKHDGHKLFSAKSLFCNRRFRGTKANEINAFLDEVGVDCMVTGHTIHDDIKVYAGRLFRLDVGMFKGTEPRALVFAPDGAYKFGADSGEKKLVGF